MADPCCDTVIGGKVYVSMGDRRFEGLGEATIHPRPVERSHGATSGGRLWVTEEARAPDAEISFANHCDADPLDLFDARCQVDVTFVEDSRGIRHLFTRASVVGWPEINLATGEVSGLLIVTDNYSRS